MEMNKQWCKSSSGRAREVLISLYVSEGGCEQI